MSASLPGKPSAEVLNGIKIMILSGALAGTIATWGWISSSSMKTVQANDDLQPTDPPVQNEFAIVIPTIMDVVTLDANSLPAPVVQTTPQPDIRAVDVLPTQSASISGPEIKTVIVNVPVSSGGGKSGGSSSKPAAKTKSS
jgi:hypothetical protein